MAAARTAAIPVYTYSLTLLDGTTRTTTGIDYEDDEVWIVFSDTHGTTLRIRRELVAEIVRGAQTATQEVDSL